MLPVTVTRPIHDRHEPKAASIYPYVIVMVLAVPVVPAPARLGILSLYLPQAVPRVICPTFLNHHHSHLLVSSFNIANHPF